LSLSGKGTAFASANRLLTLNFFRVRDALRQNIIDNSALVKALAPIGKSTDAFASWLEAGYGLGVDFTKVYFVGHSYGAIQGTASIAANPRIAAMVDVAGGATFMDVASNPQSYFNSIFLGLLAAGGIQPGTPDYLKTLQIGKWILDPADPANFAQYITGSVRPTLTTIPATLSTMFPTTSRPVLGQFSLCDGTVPNAQNTYLAAQMGLNVPSPYTPDLGRVEWLMQGTSGTCAADGVGHSIISNFSIPSLTYKAQADAATFLGSVAAGAPVNLTTPVLP
jgi:pimeloyl-ACP methyl ester carboxylesterase